MAYTTSTNTSILSFFIVARDRIVENAQLNNKVLGFGRQKNDRLHKDRAKESSELSAVISAIDNPFNDWSETEILKVIHFNSRAYKLKDTYTVDSVSNPNITV